MGGSVISGLKRGFSKTSEGSGGEWKKWKNEKKMSNVGRRCCSLFIVVWSIDDYIMKKKFCICYHIHKHRQKKTTNFHGV